MPKPFAEKLRPGDVIRIPGKPAVKVIDCGHLNSIYWKGKWFHLSRYKGDRTQHQVSRMLNRPGAEVWRDGACIWSLEPGKRGEKLTDRTIGEVERG